LFFRNEEVIFSQEDDLIKEETTNIVKIRNPPLKHYTVCSDHTVNSVFQHGFGGIRHGNNTIA
jgi:hypothetical protein